MINRRILRCPIAERQRQDRKRRRAKNRARIVNLRDVPCGKLRRGALPARPLARSASVKGRRPTCAARRQGRLCRRARPARLPFPRIPRARVFALTCEGSSWKLDPTGSNRGDNLRRGALPARPLARNVSIDKAGRAMTGGARRAADPLLRSRRMSHAPAFSRSARRVELEARPYNFAGTPPLPFRPSHAPRHPPSTPYPHSRARSAKPGTFIVNFVARTLPNPLPFRKRLRYFWAIFPIFSKTPGQ